MKNLLTVAILLIASSAFAQDGDGIMIGQVAPPPTDIQTVEFQPQCLGPAIAEAAAHQCVSPRPFGCFVEKAGVGLATYFNCASQQRFRRISMRRSRILARRARWCR